MNGTDTFSGTEQIEDNVDYTFERRLLHARLFEHLRPHNTDNMADGAERFWKNIIIEAAATGSSDEMLAALIKNGVSPNRAGAMVQFLKKIFVGDFDHAFYRHEDLEDDFGFTLPAGATYFNWFEDVKDLAVKSKLITKISSHLYNEFLAEDAWDMDFDTPLMPVDNVMPLSSASFTTATNRPLSEVEVKEPFVDMAQWLAKRYQAASVGEVAREVAEDKSGVVLHLDFNRRAVKDALCEVSVPATILPLRDLTTLSHNLIRELERFSSLPEIDTEAGFILCCEQVMAFQRADANLLREALYWRGMEVADIVRFINFLKNVPIDGEMLSVDQALYYVPDYYFEDRSRMNIFTDVNVEYLPGIISLLAAKWHNKRYFSNERGSSGAGEV